MTLPLEFSTKSQEMLQQLSFKLLKANRMGMSQEYIWENQVMQFSLGCYTYYNCSILTIKRPFESLDLIKLLRFIKNDPEFYAKELVIANLAYTLPINDYVELFYNNYTQIEHLVSHLTEDIFKRFSQYRVEYNGI